MRVFKDLLQTMLAEEDFICPICGAILPALVAYHSHYAKQHNKPTAASPQQE